MAGSWIIFDAPPSTDELLCTAEQARAQKRARKLPPFEWNEAVLSVTVAPVVQPDEHTVTAFDFVTNEPVDVAACTFEESQSHARVLPAATNSSTFRQTQATQRIARPTLLAQRHSTRLLQSSTQLEESVMSDSDGSIVDLPPEFSWRVEDLTSLDQCEAVYRQRKGKRDRPVVDCLVALRTVEKARDVGNEKRRAILGAVDATGASLPITLWGLTADLWPTQVRPGDVVWIGGVSLNDFMGRLQGNVSGKTSSIQLCYRTRYQGLEDPSLYSFHRQHAQLDNEAARVIQLVDWFQKVYR